jgi:hypothetical protein
MMRKPLFVRGSCLFVGYLALRVGCELKDKVNPSEIEIGLAFVCIAISCLALTVGALGFE